MAPARKQGLLIAGGGLAGSLAAFVLARLRPDVPFILVGEEAGFGGNATATVFHDELTKDELDLIAPLISHSWPGYYVAFPGNSRKLKAPCSAIRPADLDEKLRELLGPSRYRLKTRIVATREDSILLHGGEKMVSEGVIDARDAANLNLLDLGWRNSVGREHIFSAAHRVDRPVLVDTTLSEGADCRFTACLPLGEKALLVEDVHLSRRPQDKDREAADARIDSYLKKRGWTGGKRKQGPVRAAPVALGGDFQSFWRAGGARVAKIGIRGGLFHPTSGSPLADAVRTAILLSRQSDFSGAALHDLFEHHATAAWHKREPYRSFNAALFDGRPGGGCALLDRFYRLAPGLIAHFHAERLGLFERRKIAGLVGR